MIVMDLNTGKQIEDLRMLANELSRLAMGIPIKLYNEPSTGELYVEWFKSNTRYRMEIRDSKHNGRYPLIYKVDEEE